MSVEYLRAQKELRKGPGKIVCETRHVKLRVPSSSISTSPTNNLGMSTPVKSTEGEGYQVEAPATETAPDLTSTESSSLTSSASPPQSPTPANSNLAPLRALFPSTSDDILEAVLETHGGDLQASTESLLDLNNPDFKSEPVQQEEVRLF